MLFRSGRIGRDDKGDFTVVPWANPGEKAAAAATRRAQALDNVNKERMKKGLPPLELPAEQIDPKIASEKAMRKQQLAQNREAYLARQKEKEEAKKSTTAPITGAQRIQAEKAQRRAAYVAGKEERRNAYLAEKERRQIAFAQSRGLPLPSQSQNQPTKEEKIGRAHV